MSFKSNILKKYLKSAEIYYVIGHDSWIYLKLLVIYSIYILLLFVVYKYIAGFFSGDVPIYIRRFFGGIGLIVYFRFIVSFLDIYLDGIVLTQKGLVIFKWDGILKYSTESIEREALETVSTKQNGILDIVFNKGDIRIKRIDQTYVFNEVSNPSKQVGEIQKIRDKLVSPVEHEQEQHVDKFDMLVDVLGDVLVDYTKRNKH